MIESRSTDFWLLHVLQEPANFGRLWIIQFLTFCTNWSVVQMFLNGSLSSLILFPCTPSKTANIFSFGVTCLCFFWTEQRFFIISFSNGLIMACWQWFKAWGTEILNFYALWSLGVAIENSGVHLIIFYLISNVLTQFALWILN